MLPDGSLVTASSTGGDSLRVYSTTTKATADYPLVGAHGVIWDTKHRCLWALGTDVLQSYSYDFDAAAPALSLLETFELPAADGHDLYPRAWRNALFVTTGSGVWTFDTDDRRFEPFAPLAATAGVKSVGERSYNGRVAYTLWNDKIYFKNPDGTMSRPDASLYKARWDRLPEVTYGFRQMDTGFPPAPSRPRCRW